MKFKTTIILAIIAIVGAAYVFLYEKKQETSEKRNIYQKKIFPGLTANSVYKIKMIKNGEHFLFKKEQKDNSVANYQWMLEEPVKTRADKSIVNAFISELEFLERVRHFGQENGKKLDKKDYGLDTPTFQITFWTKQPLRNDLNKNGDIATSENADGYTFFIGNRVATGKHVYLQLKDTEEVIVVNDAIALKLDFDPNGFRDKWVMDFDKSAVSKLKVQRADGETLICSRDGDVWRMSEPVADRCDNKKIMEIITSLKNLKIEQEDFVADEDSNLEKYGLGKPKVNVTMEEQNGNTFGVSFGYFLDNKVYAKRDNEMSIFLLNDLIVSELSVKADLLRSRELVRFDTVAGTLGVDKVEIKTPQTKILIKKTKEYDWQIVEPVKTLADMDTIKELIEEVKDLRILEFVENRSNDLSKYDLDKPLFDLTVYKGDMGKAARILFGKKDKTGDQCFVKRPDEDPVFTITSKGLYEKLEGGLALLRDRLILEFDKDSVKKLTVEKEGNTFTIEKNEGKESNWILTKPVKALPDNELVDMIVHSISFLKAEKFVGQATGLNEFGFDNPLIKVSVFYEKGLGYGGITVKNLDEESSVAQPNETRRGNQLTSEEGEPDGTSIDAVAVNEPVIVSSALIIGNKVKTEDRINYFAKVDGKDTVFEIDGKIVGFFLSEIVSKSIQKFNPARAKKLVLSYHDKELIFERPLGVWKAVKPEIEGIESRQIEFLVWMLSNLQADSIKEYSLNNLIDYGLNNPDIKALVYLDDDSLYESMATRMDEDNYYIISRNSDCIFTINKEIIERLLYYNIVPDGTSLQPQIP